MQIKNPVAGLLLKRIITLVEEYGEYSRWEGARPGEPTKDPEIIKAEIRDVLVNTLVTAIEKLEEIENDRNVLADKAGEYLKKLAVYADKSS